MNFFYFLILVSSVLFFLPLKDRRSQHLGFPWMTANLVIFNVAIHAWVMLLINTQPVAAGQASWQLLYPFMEVPYLILRGEGLGALSVLTSGFLHGGWLHLIGNMFIPPTNRFCC